MLSSTVSAWRLAEMSRPTSTSADISLARRCVSRYRRALSIAMAVWRATLTRKSRSGCEKGMSGCSRQTIRPPMVCPREIKGAPIKYSLSFSSSGVPGILITRGSFLGSLTNSATPLSRICPVSPLFGVISRAFTSSTYFPRATWVRNTFFSESRRRMAMLRTCKMAMA